MTKLNVVIPAVDVLVGGVTYRKVDRKAQAGDIVRFNAECWRSFTEDAFYAVIDSEGLCVVDNDGDKRWVVLAHHTYMFEVYAPVSAEATAESSAKSTDEITFENAQYRKVDRSAREGDVIVFTDEDEIESFLTIGKPYAVTEIDWAGDPQITDDDGDDYDACGQDFDVYEKVIVEITQSYREVKRKAAVGERIKIVNTEDPRWENGEEFVVERSEGSGVMIKHSRGHIGGCAGVFDSEYSVLEPVTNDEQVRLTVGDYAKVICEDSLWNDAIKTGTIVKIDIDDNSIAPYYVKDADGNGSWARANHLEPATEAEFLAQRKPAEPVRLNVGDYVKVADNSGAPRIAEVGDIAVITNANWDGNGRIIDVETTDGRVYGMLKTRFTPATAEEVSAAKAEAQRKLAIGPFADGGFAVVVDASKSRCLRQSPNGSYVSVETTNPSPYALALTSPDGEYGGFCNADALRQITEEEYNVAIAPKPKFNAGDKIRITRSQANWPVGTIATITEVLARPNHDSGTVRASADGQSYLADGYAFDVLTAEEVAAIEKEAQKIARWAAINRKVGEFKRGDIVEVTDASQLCVGDKIINGDIVTLGFANDDGTFRLIAPGVTSGNYASAKRFKLVTPVEKRFDTEQTVA